MRLNTFIGTLLRFPASGFILNWAWDVIETNGRPNLPQWSRWIVEGLWLGVLLDRPRTQPADGRNSLPAVSVLRVLSFAAIRTLQPATCRAYPTAGCIRCTW